MEFANQLRALTLKSPNFLVRPQWCVYIQHVVCMRINFSESTCHCDSSDQSILLSSQSINCNLTFKMNVDEVLQNIGERQKKAAELVDVERPLTFDVGLLTAWDPDSIVVPKAGNKREEYFKDLARKDVQVMLNRLYDMQDVEVLEGERVLKLPEPTIILPRAKPVPKPKPPTKWEQFAQRKGIKPKSHKNRDKLSWDETTKKWVPRYGYNRVKSEEQKDWLIEIPDNADPNVDYFAKKRDEKKERVAKNKFQQLRNKERAMR